MALGARRADILWGVLRRTLWWTAAGILMGIPLALSASHVAQHMLFGLSSNDLVTLIETASLMSVLGLLAGYIPARRAASVDPLVALRYE